MNSVLSTFVEFNTKINMMKSHVHNVYFIQNKTEEAFIVVVNTLIVDSN